MVTINTRLLKIKDETNNFVDVSVIKGKNATINGKNAINITEGQNIDIVEVEDGIQISAMIGAELQDLILSLEERIEALEQIIDPTKAFKIEYYDTVFSLPNIGTDTTLYIITNNGEEAVYRWDSVSSKYELSANDYNNIENVYGGNA